MSAGTIMHVCPFIYSIVSVFRDDAADDDDVDDHDDDNDDDDDNYDMCLCHHLHYQQLKLRYTYKYSYFHYSTYIEYDVYDDVCACVHGTIIYFIIN